MGYRECRIITIRILTMSDEEKKKYIEEIFKYCKVDSILVINKTGQLQRLDCPFEVLGNTRRWGTIQRAQMPCKCGQIRFESS